MDAMTPAALFPRVSALINAVLDLEKGRTFQVRGQRIFPSEVHLLLDLAAAPRATATELAAGLGVTKGAVSQTLARLERKGLVIRTRDPDQRNALRLELTARGSETVGHFRRKTGRMRRRVEKHLAALSAAEREVIAGFLERLTEALEEMAGGR